MGKRLSEKEIRHYGDEIYVYLYFILGPGEYISQKEMSKHFKLSERTLREIIFHKRFALEGSMIVREDGKGIKLSTDAKEIRTASGKLLRQAISMIKTSKQMTKVANNIDPCYDNKQIELMFNTDKLEAHLKGQDLKNDKERN